MRIAMLLVAIIVMQEIGIEFPFYRCVVLGLAGLLCFMQDIKDLEKKNAI